MARTGYDGKLFRLASGSFGTPTWDEITHVRDVTFNIDRGTADVTTRAGGGWKESRSTLKDLSGDFEMTNVAADDADLVALNTAFTSGDAIILCFADGPLTGSGSDKFEALKAAVILTKMEKSQPLEGAVTYKFSFKNGDTGNIPTIFAGSGV